MFKIFSFIIFRKKKTKISNKGSIGKFYKMKSSKKVILYCLCCILWNLAHSQGKDIGDTSLPTDSISLKTIALQENGSYKYSIKDFIGLPAESDFKLSPDGRYISRIGKDKRGNRHLYVKDLNTTIEKQVVSEGDEEILNYLWKGNNTLIYFSDKGGNENYQVFSIDKTGENFKALTPFENVQVNLLDELKARNNEIIISMNKENPNELLPYKLNVTTGQLDQLLNQQIETGILSDYYFCDTGNLIAYDVLEDFSEYVLYYKNPIAKDSVFQKTLTIGLNDWFQILKFSPTQENPDRAFVLTNLYNDTKEIILYDLAKSVVLERLYSNEKFDLDKVSFTNQQIAYYSYSAIDRQTVAVDSKFKTLDKLMQQNFGSHYYEIISQSKDSNTTLFKISNPQNLGEYYLYKKNSKQFIKVAQLKPQLVADEMAEMRAFTFLSRDSILISGYYFKPPNMQEDAKVPLIIIPHGGPFDYRDHYEFVSYAQLFASRNYAVMQVNFRGSPGFGKEFQSLGYKQVGRNMINDLEDGLDFLLQKNSWIDKNKIALFGASYAGMAGLQSIIKQPERYACCVDIVGPTNIFSLFEAFPPQWEKYLAWFYSVWYDPHDPKEAEIIKEISPAFHLEKIKTPLFIAHGANDPRVPISESDQVVKALREMGAEVPYMVKYNEGHRWSHEENLIDLYETCLGFFAKHLKSK